LRIPTCANSIWAWAAAARRAASATSSTTNAESAGFHEGRGYERFYARTPGTDAAPDAARAGVQDARAHRHPAKGFRYLAALSLVRLLAKSMSCRHGLARAGCLAGRSCRRAVREPH